MNFLNETLELSYFIKSLPEKGLLAYEYNPFRNLRVSEDITKNGKLYKKGTLIDFDTDQLQFSLNHPVDILPQYSYDGSVNLILNDGKTNPKLINSRFSALGRNEYQIMDRYGDNDTNIYDTGDQFDLDTSLYKRVVSIPELHFLGVTNGGNLSIGNYHFYFKYVDADGNSTDFIAESGLVSVFIGNQPSGIRSGFRNENSNKSVSFYLSNIDTTYPYVEVYYTRATSDIRQNYIKEAYKINKQFLVNNAQICNLTITGFEETEVIPLSDLNIQYNIVDSAYTQASCQNMLFLGNVHKPAINYKELQDLALRFVAKPEWIDYNPGLDEEYQINSIENSYYSPTFIYDKTGYWPRELYRFGIVFVMNDNSLSPVFNIRGALQIQDDSEYSKYPLYINEETEERAYIPINEFDYLLQQNSSKNIVYENSKGVVSFQPKEGENVKILGIKFQINTIKQEENETGIQFKERKNKYHTQISNLFKKLNVKAFFITRQTRIPNILCQGLSIAKDLQSNTPIIPAKDGILSALNNYSLETEKDISYISERFLDNNQRITHNFIDRLYLQGYSPEKNDNIEANIKNDILICPEYDINQEYLNSFFTGDEIYLQKSDLQPREAYFNSDSINIRHFYNTINNYKSINDNTVSTTKIVGIPDNTKLVVLDQSKFSARAGEAEEVQKFEFIQYENKVNNSVNLLRGIYGSYLGMSKAVKDSNVLYDIRITNIPLKEQLNIRAQDSATFYSVSQRFSIDKLFGEITVFGGDCYICQFTHRINRNFNDPTAPYNDEIVDLNTWKNNIKYDHEILVTDNVSKINLGDLNAVKMGMWVTFCFRSSINLNIRGTDESWVEESILSGHPRSFYPLQAIDASGIYKLPEAACHNKGFAVSVNERWYQAMPNVPAIKNDFTNRIMYSDIHINDAFKNGFRVFRSTNYRDYDKTYGQITKLVEIGGSLLCVFEHGVALIPVNERAVAGQGAGGNVFINTSNVLPENPKIISDMYGSQWKDSILKTPKFIYGIDTVAKKIWRTDGNTLQCISDFKVQEFLNNNISLGERELTPILGIRNVKTFYNAFKQDVMFTFYDNTYGFEEKVWNLCWNETLEKFITFFSWVPSVMENIDNIPFSFNRETSKWIAKLGVSHTENSFADGITLSNVILPNSLEGNTGGDYMINPNDYKFNFTYINKQGKEITKQYTISEDSRKNLIGILSLNNRVLPNTFYDIKYSRQRDFYGNYKIFDIVPINIIGESTPGKITLPSDAMYSNKQVSVYGLKFKVNEEQYKEVHYSNNNIFNYEQIALKRTSSTVYDPVYYFEYTNNPIALLSELYYRNKEGNVYSDIEDNKLEPNSSSEKFTPVTQVTIDNLYTLNPNTEVGLYNSNGEFVKCSDPSGGTIQGLIDTKIEEGEGDNKKYYAHGVELEKHWTVVKTSIHTELPIFKNLSGKRPTLPKELQINPEKIVTLLNIRAEIFVDVEGIQPDLKEIYHNSKESYANGYLINSGYYESTIAIAPEWNLQFLSTDFWKHGQAGLIDIADDIYPTNWYGKQHPFEFECIVVNDPSVHKIFTNLELTANKAQPESFHYEIIGECYDFAKDKPNMYFRQEALKALWQYNGVDICYDRDFVKTILRQQPKSADLIHTYYGRQDTINEIEDYYISATSPNGYDYRHLSGAELVYYKNRNEYRIWQHQQAINIDNLEQDRSRSIIRANCGYLEDKWKININPILICYKNEYSRLYENSTWVRSKRGDNVPKFAIYNSPIPNIIVDKNSIELPTSNENSLFSIYDPNNINNYIDTTNWLKDVGIYKTSFGEAQNRKEIDLKDRFMKVRIRYSGEELAIIDFLRTVYRLSFV